MYIIFLFIFLIILKLIIFNPVNLGKIIESRTNLKIKISDFELEGLFKTLVLKNISSKDESSKFIIEKMELYPGYLTSLKNTFRNKKSFKKRRNLSFIL